MLNINKLIKSLGLISVVTLSALLGAPAFAKVFDEATLLQTMSQRIEYGPALRALKSDGYLRARPRIRVDYDDYYIPIRPFSVLGSRVVVVQENYLLRDVGCCADPGIGLFFEGSNVASLNRIRDFAVANKCIYRQGNALIRPELPPSFLRLNPNKIYALLRCSDGDEARRG
jgi:hypothetical protein